MAENLNYETENSWCFEDVASKCSQHGRLYTYEAALKACPTGWHLPDVEHDYYNTEYQNYVYTSPTGWQGASGTGYSDLYIEGSGIRKASGNFIYENRLSGFWFADELNSDTAFVKCEVDPSYSVRSECYNTNRELPTASNYSSSIAPKKDAYPVRCVKD